MIIIYGGDDDDYINSNVQLVMMIFPDGAT